MTHYYIPIETGHVSIADSCTFHLNLMCLDAANH